ncbi:MAG: hypothetical protein EXS02_09795 [Planctomycetes bacterium]|nr:hypothetical protein [Planctomycetota bacterium]
MRALLAALLIVSVVTTSLHAQATNQTAPAAPWELPPPATGQTRFFDKSRTFRIDLPEGWRQLAPGDVRQVTAAVSQLPYDISHNEPSMYFAVGPVDQWLHGTFDGLFLYIVYQENEWQVEGDLGEQLEQLWRKKGEDDGIAYQLSQVQRDTVGADQQPAITCIRTARPANGKPAQQSLDVYVATGGMQVSLSFTCPQTDFAQREPQLRAMLDTLRFARRARGETSNADRLWSPILIGAVVGLVLVLIYRSKRRV